MSSKNPITLDKGDIVLDTPRINIMLNNWDPAILPIAKSVSPFLVAWRHVISSGSDVPIATIVIPINFSERPIDLAINLAPSTVKSPPYFKRIMPKTIIKIE